MPRIPQITSLLNAVLSTNQLYTLARGELPVTGVGTSPPPPPVYSASHSHSTVDSIVGGSEFATLNPIHLVLCIKKLLASCCIVPKICNMLKSYTVDIVF